MATTANTYSEEDLLIGLRNRDNNAYEYLYHHYKGAMYNVILQLIPDKEIANDVLQELFITIWQKIGKYDEQKGRLFTWMVRVAHNTAINKLRSKLYISQSKNDSLDNYVTIIDQDQAEKDPINRIGLRKQVHLLRPEYKDVIELTYYNGFTHEEVAKTLDIPLGTVKTRLRNALIELRKQFV